MLISRALPVAAHALAAFSHQTTASVLAAAQRCAVRGLAAALILAGAAAATPLASADKETRESLLTGKLFSDRQLRTDNALGSYSALYVYFCGHCPTAGEHMRVTVKKLHDQIERERLPVQIICVTPDSNPQSLESWKKELGLPYVWAAQDIPNSWQISTRNILQSRMYEGSGKSWTKQMPWDQLVTAIGAKGTHRYSPAGLTDDKVKTLWWMFERGRPGAGAALVQGLASPAKAECEILLTTLRARRDALVSASASVQAYDNLEQLAIEWQGVPTAELAPVQKRMQELDKDKALADDLIARRAWKTIQGLITGNDTQYKQGVAGLDELAKKYPATFYGKKAAQFAKALATKPSTDGDRP